MLIVALNQADAIAESRSQSHAVSEKPCAAADQMTSVTHAGFISRQFDRGYCTIRTKSETSRPYVIPRKLPAQSRVRTSTCSPRFGSSGYCSRCGRSRACPCTHLNA